MINKVQSIKSYLKKYISLILTAVFVLAIAGCGKSAPASSEIQNEKKLKIVTSIFPVYDWVKEIAGDKKDSMEITLLTGKGADLHNYQPSAEDILKISECDIFIYTGGESDKWADDVLKNAVNKNIEVINLSEVLGNSLKEEEFKEGMEPESEENNEEGTEYDEHVWLSLKNAQIFCSAIEEKLEKADSLNAESYKSSFNSYNEKLKELDSSYKETVENSANKTLLFGDRFPFRYLTDDYNLSYYAAFKGCSAESEASFKTIAFLAQKADELNLNTVLTIEKSDNKIAQAVIDNTKSKDQKIKVLDSMQSVTYDEAESGISYLSVMDKNLEVLKEALK